MIVFVGGVDKRLAKHFFEESSTFGAWGLSNVFNSEVYSNFSQISSLVFGIMNVHIMKHVHLWWRCTK